MAGASGGDGGGVPRQPLSWVVTDYAIVFAALLVPAGLSARSQPGGLATSVAEVLHQVVVDQVGVLRVALDVARDEGAERDHRLARLARRVERSAREGRAQALALVGGVDLGVDEDDPPAAPLVLGEAGHLAVHDDLESPPFGVVAHLGHRHTVAAGEGSGPPWRNLTGVYLLHRWKCPWCAAARQGIENVGAPVDLVEVPYPREEREALMAVSGQRRVPVLVDGGTVIVGSRQVVRYLYSRFGGGAFERSVLELDRDIAAEGDMTGDACELPEAGGRA